MDDCLTEEKRIQYEDLYRKAWEAQCKRDAAVDPRVRLKEAEKKKRFFSVLPKDRPLTNLGRQVDRLARHNMDVHDMSLVLNISEPEVNSLIIPDDEFEEMSKVGTPPAELDPIVPTTELSFRTSKIVPSSDALFKNATV